MSLHCRRKPKHAQEEQANSTQKGSLGWLRNETQDLFTVTTPPCHQCFLRCFISVCRIPLLFKWHSTIHPLKKSCCLMILHRFSGFNQVKMLVTLSGSTNSFMWSSMFLAACDEALPYTWVLLTLIPDASFVPWHKFHIAFVISFTLFGHQRPPSSPAFISA